MCKGKQGAQPTNGVAVDKEKFEFVNTQEKVSYWLGLGFLAFLLPIVGTVVGCSVLWDALDRMFMGRPLDGVLMGFARWVNVKTASFNSRFVKQPEDAFVVNELILLGIGIPALFAFNVWYTVMYGLTPKMVFLYHLLRIGPYFMNFAYVYTMCHKEGHSRLGLFKGNINHVCKHAFNWWVGLYYGVLPSSFAYGHSINHHRYNNGPNDVVSTADKPRDSARAFVSYLPRWVLYATNVSTTLQFAREGNVPVAVKMVLGTLYYCLWVAVWWCTLGADFAFAYLLFPFGENILLLSCVSWAWHAFLNPDDPEDEFVGSLTLLDGPINVLNEDYHVVHHQYPGAHWSKNVANYDKHFNRGEYKKKVASVFKNTHSFEMFFFIMLGDYDKLFEHFVDLSGKMSEKDIRALLKSRLRCCWWGPRANLNVKLEGKEIGNWDDGRPALETKKD